MNKEELHIHKIILTILDGSATDEQHKKLEQWLEKSEQNKTQFQQLKKDYQEAGHFVYKDTETDQAFELLQSKIDMEASTTSTRRMVLTWGARIAAVLVLAFLARLLFVSAPSPIIYSNHSEQILWDTLPDGSILCLKPNAEITLAPDFNQTNRTVSLIGEAWFDIYKDKSKPFFVHFGNYHVKVTGTSFNISTHINIDSAEVFVSSGSVQLSNFEGRPSENSFKMDLRKGDFAAIQHSEANKLPLPDPNYLAWQSNTLTFHRIALGDVIEKVEQHYRTKISCSLENPNRYLVSATFEKLECHELVRRLNKKVKSFTTSDSDIICLNTSNNKPQREL